MILFDIETNGLLDPKRNKDGTVTPPLSKVHCLVTHDTDTGTTRRFRGDDIRDSGLPLLAAAPSIGGHNVIKFDLPALKKIYGWQYLGEVFDTLVMSKLLFTDMGDADFKLFKKKQIPGKLIGSHSLKAWGYRLGIHKGTYAEDTGEQCWDTWSEEMEDYCEQDVHVTHALYSRQYESDYSKLSQWIEHEFCKIIQRQESRGVAFDEEAAGKLWCTLSNAKAEVEGKLKAVFGSWQELDREFVPERDNKRLGYKAGVLVKKYKTVEFNPGSRNHIAKVLMKKYGWKPTVFTDKGQIQVDESIISNLPFPECPLILEYLTLDKRIGQLAEGNQAWLKHVRNGRIHGSVNTGGAVTGRCTHSNPNLAQVPAGSAAWGKECRSLFTASGGYVLVGCDAAALELRCLAHYMARWDDGEYGRVVDKGKKEDGTDVHTVNYKAMGVEDRDKGKTKTYAYLYGAGDENLGDGNPSLGRKRRRNLETNIPALGKLVPLVKSTAKRRGYLIGIDGRKLHVRYQHAAFNTLLQSAGAIVMKVALIIADWYLQAEGLVQGVHYEVVLSIHDEYQFEALPEKAEFVGQALASAIHAAGHLLNFRCPLSGEYKIGKNWSETH